MHTYELDKFLFFFNKYKNYILALLILILLFVVFLSLHSYYQYSELESDSKNYDQVIIAESNMKSSTEYFKKINSDSLYYQLAQFLIATNSSSSDSLKIYKDIAKKSRHDTFKQLASFYLEYFALVDEMSQTSLIDSTLPYYTNKILKLLIIEKLANDYFYKQEYTKLYYLLDSINLDHDDAVTKRLRLLKNIADISK